MIYILTHNDLDGYSAGYIMSHYFEGQEQRVIFGDYSQKFDVSVLEKGDILTITDYSIPPEDLLQAVKNVGLAGRIIWIDHHISAINSFNEAVEKCDNLEDQKLYSQIEGIWSTKYCGAMLTEIWTELENVDMTSSNENIHRLAKNVPYYLKLIDAWDCWKLDSPYRKSAEYLSIAVQDDLSFDVISQLAHGYTDNYVDKGKAYVEFKNRWATKFSKKYGFDVKHVGQPFGVDRAVTVKVLTLGNANSTYFGDDIDTYDVCITQCFNGENWILSLYSNKKDIDVSVFAKEHDGGGHKGAAGCYFKQLVPPFYKIF